MRGRVLSVGLAGALLLAGCVAHRATLSGNPENPYPPKGGEKAGEIYHLPTGLRISEDQLMDMLAGARLVSVGETHDNLSDKKVELAVIKGLYRRFPGKIAIGMEMFRTPQQGALDRWVKGELTELEFLKESKWYRTWGFDFSAYRDILLFAREKGIDVIALDPSRELQDEVSRTGLDNLPAELSRRLPRIDESDPYQREVLRGIFSGHEGHAGGEAGFASFYRVQLLWEETMAQRVADYLESPRGEGKRMVTITGGWHVMYGFGLPKKVIRRMPMPYAILLTKEISTPEQKAGRLMNVNLPDVPLLPADFQWCVPFEAIGEKRVRMGIGMEEKDGHILVETVVKGSAAEAAGISKGDELVSFDGKPVRESIDVYYLVGEKREGDTALVTVRRGGVEKTLGLTFRHWEGTLHPPTRD